LICSFDFDQKETECVIEAVGDRESVQEYFQNVIIQEAAERKISESSINGTSKQNGQTLSMLFKGTIGLLINVGSTVRNLIFSENDPSALLQNGHASTSMCNEDDEMMEDDGDSHLLNGFNKYNDQPPIKISRLHSNVLDNETIIARFEKLEERIRRVEQRQNHINNIEKMEEFSETDISSIEVEIDNKRFKLKQAPIDGLLAQIEQNRKNMVEKDPLVNYPIQRYFSS
jgi:hypothetical protein